MANRVIKDKETKPIKKNPQNNIQTSELAKLRSSRTWLDFVRDDATLFFPGKDEWRQRYMLAFVEWAQDENSLDIMQFCIEVKIHRRRLYEWIEDYPDFKKAFDEVKLILGVRRRNGSLTRKYDKDVVFKDMHRYDSEWVGINKENADLKRIEALEPTVFNINCSKPEIITKDQMKVDNETI